MPHIDTWIPLALLGAAIALGAGLIGHKLGERRHRHDYADGFDAGEDGERAKWETITGRAYGDVKGLLRDRPLPLHPRTTDTRDDLPAQTAVLAGPPPPATADLLAAADTVIRHRDHARPADAVLAAADAVDAQPDYLAAATAGAGQRAADMRHRAASRGELAPLPEPELGPPVVADITSPASLPPVWPPPQLTPPPRHPVEAYARLALVRAECAAFLAQTDARCDAFLTVMRAEADAFLTTVPLS